ncbi:MAG: Fe(3+) ABC transporter substrate-binding protein [Xenococcaceae cyanobacterium]
MKSKQRHVLGILAGISLLITSACSNDKQQATQEQAIANTVSNSGEQLNIYSARHYDSDRIMYDDFTKKTGIKVNIIEGKDDELIERIKSEGKNSPADVLITVDVGRLWRAQQEGAFQPISSKVLDKAIPENLRSPKGDWYAFSKRARVFVYNTNKVKPTDLSSYQGLTEPQWKGRVCVRSSGNIYNQSLVAAMIERDGEAQTRAWVKGLVANFARQPEGGDTDQIKYVASGECDVAIVNHYYFARLKGSEDPKNKEITSNVAVFFPNQDAGGTHVNISGAGVVVNAPDKENATKFLEFLSTPEAQEIFANQNNEYPAIAGLKPNPIVASFGKFKESQLNVAAYGEKNAQAVKIMDEAGWK